ncbi:TPA: helix-turn-helix domain-containing protein [Klebsiella pneumoniae]|uniref:helix-turn-helix domain-containing protein n=1 Tax=Klebsiella pneumoniae TaxID=573 RepID=UPI001C7EEB9B|nr:helix-turn-helix domain-containing protein [Klebsiella pneumoniae]MBX4517578.1 helix-turn-helix domain-containing protein [Klebsiella pneumoniae]HCF8671114.1 helix-turn-helix domain-containing protein [Klebsiella pneumoniae]HCT7764665.1 helix-turn-helix domain-containing protein [Klebsiella pneumoniae]
MSVKLSAWIWDGCAAHGVGGTRLLVMARLADFSSDEGICWPSIQTIARQIGAGESTVRTAIRSLEQDGWLVTTQRRRGNRNDSNMYQLSVEKLRSAALFQPPEFDPSKSDPSKTDASDSDPSDSDPSESSKKPGFHPPESGGDPSVTTDPSLQITTSPKSAISDGELSTGDDQPEGEEAGEEKKYPDAAVVSGTRWGTAEDLTCATWIFARIKKLYERAAESDGELSLPKEPNWASWANDIRLMRTVDGHTHRQICKLFERVQCDSFWCRNVLSPGKLREKWVDLMLRLAPGDLTEKTGVLRASYDDDYYKNEDPDAYRGFRVANK